MKITFAFALIVGMLLGNNGWLKAEQAAPRKTMRAFASEHALNALLKRWTLDAEKRRYEYPAPLMTAAPRPARATTTRCPRHPAMNCRTAMSATG